MVQWRDFQGHKKMTYRNRALLDLAHDAPCMLLLGARGCGNDPSVPCHSDLLHHGRGIGHKSGDQFAVPGCPACHAIFTREYLGRRGDGYFNTWLTAHERYLTWLFETGRLRVAKKMRESHD